MMKSNHILYNADNKNCRFPNGLDIVKKKNRRNPDFIR